MSSPQTSPVGSALQDRFRGVLLGLALGDAFGAPLEAQPPSPHDRAHTELTGGGWLQLAPGEWTDEAYLALETVKSLLQKRVFDPDDIARRFVEWFRGKPRTVEEHTRKVLQRMAAGETWEEASIAIYQLNPEYASSGSLRRCAPLALFFFNRPQHLPVLTPVLSRITHAHPDAEMACVILNLFLAYLTIGEEKKIAYRSILETARELSPSLLEVLERANAPSISLQPTGKALEALEVAFRALLHTNRFENALIVAVNQGGDTTAVGAITGALAGALYGFHAIPAPWSDLLYKKEELIALADQLLILTTTSVI